MYNADREPILWLLELFAYLFLLSLFQLVSAFTTIIVIRSSLHTRTKIILTLSFIALVAAVYRGIVDYNTHLQVAMISGFSLSFTIPLNAMALLHLHKPGTTIHMRETLLRIAFPAAVPSTRYPSESPSLQAVRGVLYLFAVITLTAPVFLSTLSTGGLRMYLAAVAFMFTVAPAILNLSAATLGFLGASSPAPFRAPLFSPSLSAFWAGRWNAAVSDALRAGIYEPLIANGISRPVAVIACFTVSGVAHEGIMLHSRRYGSGARWFGFFLVQGMFVTVERAAHRFLPKPGWRRWPLVAGILLLSFVYLFVPATLHSGLARDAVESFRVGAHVADSVFRRVNFVSTCE